jgi:prophage antirepressor-like protein
MDAKSQSKREVYQTIPLKFDGQIIRMVFLDNQPWFVAQELSLCNTSKTVSCLDDDEKGITSSYTLGGSQQHLIVNESGLYALILRCRNAMKKGTVPYKFRKWVTSEVLPSIRKTGVYSTHAAYPGSMTPTNCIVLTCHASDGSTKQAYLMYNSGDMWFGCPKWCPDYENVLQSSIKRIGEVEDSTVWYETRGYSLKNGKYEASPFLYPKHDKRPKNENAVTNCQKAIERYQKAKDDVKTSAAAMVEYLNTHWRHINLK